MGNIRHRWFRLNPWTLLLVVAALSLMVLAVAQRRTITRLKASRGTMQKQIELLTQSDVRAFTDRVARHPELLPKSPE